MASACRPSTPHAIWSACLHHQRCRCSRRRCSTCGSMTTYYRRGARMTNRYQELAAMLRTLNLSRMATSFEEVAVRAVREGRSHEAFLHELARLECEHRQVRRIERRVRASGLPLDKTFRTLQMAPFGAVLAQQIER